MPLSLAGVPAALSSYILCPLGVSDGLAAVGDAEHGLGNGGKR